MTHKGLKLGFALLYSFIFLLLASAVSAQVNITPEGPDQINVTNASRGEENSPSVAIEAQAGNVTELVIFDSRLTKSWQGYYGNITGEITLDDSSGNTFYNWQVANPRGEIYASNRSAVNWLSVYCLNVTQNEGQNADKTVSLPVTRPSGDVSSVNSTRIELEYGINATDHDGLNETFYAFYTSTTGFTVGGITIDNDDGCSLGHPFVNSETSTAWDNLILSENNSLIFTAVLREDAVNFKGMASDFQMLVLENGQTGEEATTTTYYFWVELT